MAAGAVDPWGRVAVSTADLFELLYRDIDPAGLCVEGDALLDEYNRCCVAFGKFEHQIAPAAVPGCTPAEEHARRAGTWFIPGGFETVDVRRSLLDRCVRDDERARVEAEMDLFEARDLLPLLRMMFALVQHFRDAGIVWGVGRGSSCASYCLYLIGVHKVDALRFGLDIGEFLKPV